MIDKQKALARQQRYRAKTGEKRRRDEKAYYWKNRDKLKKKALDWYRRNRDTQIAKLRDRRYPSKATRPAPEFCEACRTPFAMTTQGSCFDHDHKTGEFRGWLCANCNFAIGYAKDSRDRLQLLINYLDRHELLR